MRKELFFILLVGLFGFGLIVPGAVMAQKVDPTKVSASLKAAGGAVGGIGYVQVTAFSKIVEEMYPKVK